jgi:hypothetical protein
MSASPVISSAAVGRPFIFPACASAHTLTSRLGSLKKLATAVTPASRLHVRPAPDMVSSGIRELDALTGGLPRGCLTEICGPASSGRTSILLAALAQATRRGEVCALVDASDALHPASAAAAGVQLEHLLWVRCATQNPPRRRGGAEKCDEKKWASEWPFFSEKGSKERKNSESRLDQVLKVTDLLLQSNGFGMIVLDLADIPARSARRISLASWFRFRRAVEHTPTVLLILEQQPIAGSCSSILMKVTGKQRSAFSAQHSANHLTHTELLDELQINAELLRSRLERKPPHSATANFRSQASWAG